MLLTMVTMVTMAVWQIRCMSSACCFRLEPAALGIVYCLWHSLLLWSAVRCMHMPQQP